MNKRAWWPTIAACLVLVGCAAGDFRPRDGATPPKHVRFNDQACTGAICQIDVRVDCDTSPCVAVVDPKVLLVFRANDPKAIHWNLKGEPGYRFANERVDLDPSEFTCHPPGADRKLLVCWDDFKHANPEVYEYQLKVVKESDGSTLTIDPWIVPK